MRYPLRIAVAAMRAWRVRLFFEGFAVILPKPTTAVIVLLAKEDIVARAERRANHLQFDDAPSTDATETQSQGRRRRVGDFFWRAMAGLKKNFARHSCAVGARDAWSA